MSRAERLLALMQVLRRRRRPAGGARLAEELSASLRTLYIASLQAQGATIELPRRPSCPIRASSSLYVDNPLRSADFYAEMRARPMAQAPTDLDFGRTFVALDPDGRRLRVFAPA